MTGTISHDESYRLQNLNWINISHDEFTVHNITKLVEQHFNKCFTSPYKLPPYYIKLFDFPLSNRFGKHVRNIIISMYIK